MTTRDPDPARAVGPLRPADTLSGGKRMSPRWRMDRKALMDRAMILQIHPTITGISAALNVAPSTLSRALTGSSAPGQDLLAAIRLVFGAEGFDEIVTVTDEDDDAAASPDVW